MDPEQRRAIASKGGKSVPAEKRSFAANPALAAKAGSIGGKSVSNDKRTFSTDRVLASKAGRKGGFASRDAAKNQKSS